MPPPHESEHVVVPGLRGHVEDGHQDVGVLGNGIDDPFTHVPGVRSSEPQPLQPRFSRRLGRGNDEVVEGSLRRHVSAIGVYVLAKKRRLLEPRCAEAGELGQDRRGLARLLDAARRRDDAVRASFVASVGHVDPRHHFRPSPGRVQRFGVVGGGGGDDLLAHGGLFENIQKSASILRAHDDVDFGYSSRQPLAFLLRHAAGNDNHHVFAPLLPTGVRS
mmetsp:Transcript_20673/g.70013  ORF Transcript_20673/g.70013 Transcript_20673/m.70013 type:complete len:219 (-) Transcript_20673:998-1654(-)